MIQPQIEISREDFEKDFPGENRRDFMGLAFFVEDNFRQRFIGHWGDQNGFVMRFFYQPETRSSYVVGFNTNGPKTYPLDARIKEYLFRNIFPLFAKGD